jgi:hypothetical protein
MASNVTAKVINAANLKPAEKLTLLVMAEYSNPEGKSIYPSQVTISKKTGYTRPAINRIMAELTRRGILTKLTDQGPKGQFYYEINLDALDQLTYKTYYTKKQADPDNLPTTESQPEAAGVSSTITPETNPEPPENSPMLPTITGGCNLELQGGVSSRVTRTCLKDSTDLNNTDTRLKNCSEGENCSCNQEPTNQEPDKPEKTNPPKSDIPKPDYFWDFKAVYDKNAANAKTYPWGVMQIQDLAAMVIRLNAIGVTYQDFENAITNQDQDPRYHGKIPTSYEVRAWNEKNLRAYGHYINPSKYPYNRDGTPKSPDPAGDNKPFTYLIDLDQEPVAIPIQAASPKPSYVEDPDGSELSTMFSIGITHDDIDAAKAANPGKPIYLLRMAAKAERDKRLALERAEKAAALVEVSIC